MMPFVKPIKGSYSMNTINMTSQSDIESLKKELDEKRKEIKDLKQKLAEVLPVTKDEINSDKEAHLTKRSKLTNSEISRYSRQLILPEIGVKGQLALAGTSVLIVGAGGLGCPAAIYLAAAGIGRLGIVDYDLVELSNLHRQILHTETRVDVCKSVSAAASCKQLNSFVECVPYHLQLDSSNALQIIEKYDIVLDATDNVATRYLLNDACVLAGRPLVSGSALRFEGQLTVYNYKGGPCYRCLYPKPPPPETVTNCSDGGVLGVIPGIIGSLQALETIKIAVGIESTYSQRLLMFDGLDGTFRTIRLRGRQAKCPLCGESPSIEQLIDYEQFCGAKASDKDKSLNVLENSQRISPKEYSKMLENDDPHVLIDVRQPVEMDICKLPSNFINIPLSDITKNESLDEIQTMLKSYGELKPEQKLSVICVCRRGNDSQLAVQKLREKLHDLSNVKVTDITGGLTAWAKTVDPNFPVY